MLAKNTKRIHSVGLFAAAFFLLAGQAFGQSRLAGRFGEASIGGQRVIVHVTVLVPRGQSEDAVAGEALRGQGARPIQSAAFKLTNFKWNNLTDDNPNNTGAIEVEQHYNPASEPPAASGTFADAQNTWNNVGSSKFAFSYGGTTTRCPSLVNECPGPQKFDGNNDVGWVKIGGCCTLGVTWYGTSSTLGPETDMALNWNMLWAVNGDGDATDPESVFLHELGHSLGLDHSTVAGSIMQAYYQGVQQTLGEDDIRGVTYLYPKNGAVGSISGTVNSSTGAIAGATISVANLPATATTNELGVYELPGVPDIGVYSVTASARGFQSKTETGVDVPTTVHFTLTKSCRGKNCP